MRSQRLAVAIYVATVSAFAALPGTAYAVKGHCEGDLRWQCTVYATSKEDGAWYDPKTGQWYNKSCGCRAQGGSSSGSSDGGPPSYGHAEIHKRNVPTVKPSGAGPSNLARPPLGMTPRAPAATFQPARPF